MKLSVIVPSLTGEVPQSLRTQVSERKDVEVVVVKGVSPVGRARNEGLDRAKGDYLAWVDSDDEVECSWLDEILAALVEEPDVVVIGHKWMLNANAVRVSVWRGGDLLESVLSQRILRPEMWNFVIRRNVWDGVRFKNDAHTFEDWEVMPRLLAKVRTVCRIDKPLYRYSVRGGSLTHQVDEATQKEAFQRAIARLPEIKRLGLWKRYGRIAKSGVGYMVYGCAEMLALSGNVQSPTKRGAERWIRRHFLSLMTVPAPLTFKSKWVLATLGLWGVVKWYYLKHGGAPVTESGNRI